MRGILLSVAVSLGLMANCYILPYEKTAGVGTQEELNKQRDKQERYFYSQPDCCCNSEILSDAQTLTKETNRLFFAGIDNLIQVLSNECQISKLQAKENSNYIVKLSLSSFYQKRDLLRKEVQEQTTKEGEGCQPIDPNDPTSIDYFVENVIDRFETSSSGIAQYGEGTSYSSAYGRYQFVNKTGNDYCQKVGDNCCVYWRSNTPKGRECQDRMFELFLKDNLRQLENKNIPLNTCTVYLSHQQGVGGLLWLRGGKNPYKNFATLKDAIYKNVGSKYQPLVAQATTEDELREVYTQFWSEKFGGDINADVGSIVPISDFVKKSEEIDKLVEYRLKKRKSVYREGILLDLLKLKTLITKDKDYE